MYYFTDAPKSTKVLKSPPDEAAQAPAPLLLPAGLGPAAAGHLLPLVHGERSAV